MVKLIILAAGKGERLYPLTRNTPKPLLDMGNGKTLLEEQIQRIRQSKVVREIILVTGYLADQIEAKMQYYVKMNIPIRTVFNPFYDMSNNLISLWLARYEMQDDFLIANGDCIFSADIFSGIVKNKKQGIILSTNCKKTYDNDDMKVCLEGSSIARVSKEITVRKAAAESPGLALVRGAKYRKVFVDNLEALVRDRATLNQYWLEVFNTMVSRGITVRAWPFGRSARWQEVDFHLDVQSVKDILKIRKV